MPLLKNVVVVIISGHTFAGKSHLLRKLRSCVAFAESPMVEMDRIRQRVWGGIRLTREEHRYKNELARRELEQMIILEHPPFILAELGMPTRDHHQKPLVEMVTRATRTLAIISEEKSNSENNVAEDFRVHLRVVQLYCDVETIHRHLRYRLQSDDQTGTHVFDLNGMAQDLSVCEVPIDYQPLILDTSDQTKEAQRWLETNNFLTLGELPSDNPERRERYRVCLENNIRQLRTQ